ncbi:alpha/beta hydrolase family protein [Hymenobacter terrenus]|uniref:alpha/beta hydrolase family protein n=1 Tax=Hymenobacter terrenus TaxID=1629124 RepID=UPI000619C885|nr:alpha/beta fold hydrolase [Hymenobacter terrenus]
MHFEKTQARQLRNSPLRKIGVALWAVAIVLMAAVTTPTIAQEAIAQQWAAAPTTGILTETKTFRNGNATLSGTLYLPRGGQVLGAVVVTHTASKPLRDAPLYRHLIEMLPPLGIAVLTYDRRGSGQSGGSLRDSDYLLLADDAIAAVRMLKTDSRIDPERIGIWGLSQGGWLSLLAATRSSDVRFVVSIAAPIVAPDVQMMFRSESYLRINDYPEADIAQMRAARQAVDDYMRGTGDRAVAQALVDAAATKPWFDQLYLGKTVGDRATSRWRREIEYDPLPTLDHVRVPALILFGANDPVVPVATSVTRINARSRPNLTVRVVAGADHHMATSMSPRAQMDPNQTERVRPEAPEYFSLLAGWLTNQEISRVK